MTFSQLKNAIKTAVDQGLQLVILNSCDGLLLARDLVDLSVPYMIVMREKVQDLIAQEFLKDFLHRFAQEGKPLHLAVREAREKLQGWEDEIPCASWLPVICQNTTEVPPTWKQLRQGIKLHIPVQNFLKSVLVTSILMTAVVVGIRHLGWLEAIELKEFDRLVQLRPHEKPDSRILVVEATSEDYIKQYDRLPDGILARAIKQLDRHQPLIIGLNIFRERPVAPGHAELATIFQNNKHLVTVCRYPDDKNLTISPPSEVTEIERIGFIDVMVDPIDNILRRHPLFIQPIPNSPCKTDNAFSVLLALTYLEAKGIEAEVEQGDREEDKWLKLGTVVFKPLKEYAGGYQRLDARGSQILLNYRWPEVAQRITLKQVLDGEIKSEWVKNKIVIIGVTDQESSGDNFSTPYSASQHPYQEKEISGVILQAQMVSQIISAVSVDKRPLLRVWPEWGDVLWIWGWGVVGGMMVWWGRSRLIILLLKTGIVIITLWGSCFVILLFKGFWVPLVPSVLTILANVCLMGYSLAKPQKTSLNP